MTTIDDGVTAQAHQLAVDMCNNAGITPPNTTTEYSLAKSLWFLDQAFKKITGRAPVIVGSFTTGGTLTAGSLGISSVTHNSSGHATVNFSVDFLNTNYTVVLSPVTNNDTVGYLNPTTSSIDVTNTVSDTDLIAIVVYT